METRCVSSPITVTLICYVVKSQPNTYDADHLFRFASLHMNLLSFHLPGLKHLTGLKFHDIFHSDFPDSPLDVVPTLLGTLGV